MLSIKIKKTEYGNLVAKINDGELFEFAYRKETNSWCFWLFGETGIIKYGPAFPWIYFYELCRVVAFLKFNKALWETVNPKVVSGKSYIK